MSTTLSTQKHPILRKLWSSRSGLIPGLPAGHSVRIGTSCGAVTTTASTTVVGEVAESPTIAADGKPWTFASGAGVNALPQNNAVAAPSSYSTYAGGSN